LGSTENIGNLLYCSSVLERKTYEMYYELSQKFDHPTIKPKIVTIAQDSLKHCNMFEEISKELISKPPTKKQCKRSFGETWNHIDEITDFLKEKGSFTEKDFFEIINRLAVIEHNLGEE
jgi:rubrerythrin